MLELGLAVVGVVALTLAITGFVLARGNAARHRAAADRATVALAEETRSTADEREVRGLILASMDDGVLLFDSEHVRVFANEAITRHLGDSPEHADRLRPTALRDAVRRSSYTGATIETEVEIGSPTRWLRATAQPAGSDGSVLLVIQDITGARRLDAARRDFVANASHELKTPVASIRAAAETLRDGAAEDPDAGPLSRLRSSATPSDSRGSSQISWISRAWKLAASATDAVALDELVVEEAERRRTEAEVGDVRLDVAVDGVSPIAGSTRDLRLLASNLIDNAIRYTQPGGTVDVEVRAEPGTVVIRVSDTGIGIPQRDLPRIFERFYRVDQARSRETGGTGLGLAIVKHVSENHGGEVTVSSELGRGSTFEVRLPAAATSTT